MAFASWYLAQCLVDKHMICSRVLGGSMRKAFGDTSGLLTTSPHPTAKCTLWSSVFRAGTDGPLPSESLDSGPQRRCSSGREADGNPGKSCPFLRL